MRNKPINGHISKMCQSKTTVFGYPRHNPQVYAILFAIKVSKFSENNGTIQVEKSINKQINNRASLSWQVRRAQCQ
jgi:translation elongation factor EF-4